MRRRRTYKRDAKGRFAKTNSSRGAAALKRKPTKSKARSKPSPVAKKGMSKKKKAAIAGGVAAGVVVAGAAAYGMEYRSMKNEFNRSGGPLSTVSMGNGISVTTARTFKTHFTRVDEVAVNDLFEAQTLKDVAKAGSRIWNPSLRPQVHSTHYIHSDDRLLGYATDVVKGKKLYANELYLRPSERGNRRTVAGMSNMMKQAHSEQVNRGRKIVISAYRSEDSERIVRNQARKLGKNKVIVKKRYNPSSKFAAEIKESMDGYFEHNVTNQFKQKRKAAAKRSGVVI